MLPTRFLRVAVVALATLAVACGDLTRPKATTPKLQLDYSVYAMTGAPVGVTNAINFFAGPARAMPRSASTSRSTSIRPDKITVCPVRALAGTIAGTIPTRVGLQTVAGTFESVRDGAASGLRHDQV